MSSAVLPHPTEDLVTTFKQIAIQSRLDLKFCFFIYGLDEYNGDESDILPMLQVLSASPHVKICASSRPGRIYEKVLRNKTRGFDIARFTKSDMRTYVHTRLKYNAKFRYLAASEPSCDTIISDISNYADGFWLWVFLVTRDILYEVERDEGISTPRKIVDDFPSDLVRSFERIVERIKDRHKEEMAQMFLVTVHKLQPLPLYAFALLEEERTNSDYALVAPVKHVAPAELEPHYLIWRSRVQNRCGDLVVVDQAPHPVFLSHSVDFLHRTVRDVLRDCYHDELEGYFKSGFNTLVSLRKICLSLLKALPMENFRDRESMHRVIGVSDEFFYYAREVEKNSGFGEELVVHALLDELDVINCKHARRGKKSLDSCSRVTGRTKPRQICRRRKI